MSDDESVGQILHLTVTLTPLPGGRSFDWAAEIRRVLDDRFPEIAEISFNTQEPVDPGQPDEEIPAPRLLRARKAIQKDLPLRWRKKEQGYRPADEWTDGWVYDHIGPWATWAYGDDPIDLQEIVQACENTPMANLFVRDIEEGSTTTKFQTLQPEVGE
jgi:hypothetical protein